MNSMRKKEFQVGDRIVPTYMHDGTVYRVIARVTGPIEWRGNWFLGTYQTIKDEYVLLDEKTGKNSTLELDSRLWANDYEVVR